MSKVVIIGAGFTGLSAAFYLNQAGFDVTIIEKEDQPGGLAGGFKAKSWQWPLEYFYHHIFASDKDIINLVKQTGLDHMLIFKTPKTSLWLNGQIVPLDSPIDVLTFPFLDLRSKIHLGAGLSLLKALPDGTWLERWPLERIIPILIGVKAYQVIFEPLVRAKFGPYSNKVNAAWFWARIKARTKKLGYFKTGFLGLAQALSHYLKSNGVKIIYNSQPTKIKGSKLDWQVETQKLKLKANYLILTNPPFSWQKYHPTLSNWYQTYFAPKDYLGAQTIILRLKQPLLTDQTYWLNINHNYPFLILAEHTNLIDKRWYNNEHIVYIGNYLTSENRLWTKSVTQLISLFLPYLKKINPDFSLNWIYQSHKFQSRFAQPVMPVNYSRLKPPLRIPNTGLFPIGMFNVYPYDRGTNYAVALGRLTAGLIARDS